MIRPAEDILNSCIMEMGNFAALKARIITAINVARKETLEHLADKAFIMDDNFNPVITKEEILSVINELK